MFGMGLNNMLFKKKKKPNLEQIKTDIIIIRQMIEAIEQDKKLHNITEEEYVRAKADINEKICALEKMVF